MQDYINHPIVQGYIKANRFGELLQMKFCVPAPGRVDYTMEVTESHLATPV
ncbi:MAG: hypothetical protein HRT57_02675, partial [Crocinitomicaceae bacterium]|nr:hypothetical protein [Crocinitomicaceae bacterium]